MLIFGRFMTSRLETFDQWLAFLKLTLSNAALIFSKNSRGYVLMAFWTILSVSFTFSVVLDSSPSGLCRRNRR